MKNILSQEIQLVEQTLSTMQFNSTLTYSNWLAQTYFFVRHSTRLLNLSAALSPFELQFFHKRANEHAHEEVGHEVLIENDLKQMGLKLSSFSENLATSSLYQCQYFSIQNIHPMSFLGYVMLLETLPITFGSKILPQIEHTHGKGACSFVRVHAKEDVDHMESLMKTLEKVDPKIIFYIEKNLKQARSLYIHFLDEISEKSVEKKKAS